MPAKGTAAVYFVQKGKARALRAIDLTGKEYHHEPEDVGSLKRLARILPRDPVVVNIGACFGTSALALLEARGDLFVFSVDVEPCEAERENLARGHLDTARCVRVLGRSQDIGRHWPYKVDMVFVDGSHVREDVIGDIEAWLPKIKPGGIMAFDDVGKPICAAVQPVVNEYMIGKYEVILSVGDVMAFRIA